jgi:hypothetical protein
MMTHKRLANAFTKAGCSVKNVPSYTTGRASSSWIATNPKNKKTIEWHTQSGYDPVAKDQIGPQETSYCVIQSPETDVQADYFCDMFYYTIKRSVAAITGA